MSEQTMRQRVNRALFGLDPMSVENPVNPGTPDVNFIEGWIELKWLRRWPRENSTVTIRHFTNQQRVWLRRRHFHGGRAWLLLQAGQEWLLFDGTTASQFVGRVSKRQLLEVCRRHWKYGLIDSELREVVNEQKTGTAQ